MSGVVVDIENGIEDVTQPSDVWRQYKLTGERWIQVRLPVGADAESRATFERIREYILEQAVR